MYAYKKYTSRLVSFAGTALPVGFETKQNETCSCHCRSDFLFPLEKSNGQK
jgi:hypothetical protein